MAFAPLDLLARIIAARPSGFGRFDALAVNDGALGLASRPIPWADRQDQRVVHPLEHDLVT
jgi:hypothetical protein